MMVLARGSMIEVSLTSLNVVDGFTSGSAWLGLKTCSWRCLVAVTLMGRDGGVSPPSAAFGASNAASSRDASIEGAPPLPSAGSLVPPGAPVVALVVVGDPPAPVALVDVAVVE